MLVLLELCAGLPEASPRAPLIIPAPGPRQSLGEAEFAPRSSAFTALAARAAADRRRRRRDVCGAPIARAAAPPSPCSALARSLGLRGPGPRLLRRPTPADRRWASAPSAGCRRRPARRRDQIEHSECRRRRTAGTETRDSAPSIPIQRGSRPARIAPTVTAIIPTASASAASSPSRPSVDADASRCRAAPFRRLCC